MWFTPNFHEVRTLLVNDLVELFILVQNILNQTTYERFSNVYTSSFFDQTLCVGITRLALTQKRNPFHREDLHKTGCRHFKIHSADQPHDLTRWTDFVRGFLAPSQRRSSLSFCQRSGESLHSPPNWRRFFCDLKSETDWDSFCFCGLSCAELPIPFENWTGACLTPTKFPSDSMNQDKRVMREEAGRLTNKGTNFLRSNVKGKQLDTAPSRLILKTGEKLLKFCCFWHWPRGKLIKLQTLRQSVGISVMVWEERVWWLKITTNTEEGRSICEAIYSKSCTFPRLVRKDPKLRDVIGLRASTTCMGHDNALRSSKRNVRTPSRTFYLTSTQEWGLNPIAKKLVQKVWQRPKMGLCFVSEFQPQQMCCVCEWRQNSCTIILAMCVKYSISDILGDKRPTELSTIQFALGEQLLQTLHPCLGSTWLCRLPMPHKMLVVFFPVHSVVMLFEVSSVLFQLLLTSQSWMNNDFCVISAQDERSVSQCAARRGDAASSLAHSARSTRLHVSLSHLNLVAFCFCLILLLVLRMEAKQMMCSRFVVRTWEWWLMTDISVKQTCLSVWLLRQICAKSKNASEVRAVRIAGASEIKMCEVLTRATSHLIHCSHFWWVTCILLQCFGGCNHFQASTVQSWRVETEFCLWLQFHVVLAVHTPFSPLRPARKFVWWIVNCDTPNVWRLSKNVTTLTWPYCQRAFVAATALCSKMDRPQLFPSTLLHA